MKDRKELLISWLKDAHAMESNLITMLDKQVKHLEGHSELKRRVEEHAQESRRHADRVKECLERLGSDTSALKEGMAKISGMLGPSAAAMASDEVVKICLANYAAEHFEIASYMALRTAAEDCGEHQIAEMAEEILRDEEAMAQFLDEHLHLVTRAELQEHATAGAR